MSNDSIQSFALLLPPFQFVSYSFWIHWKSPREGTGLSGVDELTNLGADSRVNYENIDGCSYFLTHSFYVRSMWYKNQRRFFTWPFHPFFSLSFHFNVEILIFTWPFHTLSFAFLPFSMLKFSFCVQQNQRSSISIQNLNHFTATMRMNVVVIYIIWQWQCKGVKTHPSQHLHLHLWNWEILQKVAYHDRKIWRRNGRHKRMIPN